MTRPNSKLWRPSLRESGVEARGYAADVRDGAALEAALAQAAAELGPITVLQYSPLPARTYLKPVLDLTPELALEALQFSALGLIHAVRAVLPAMRETGDGSIVLINGGTSVKARAGFAGTSVAFPAESAYGEMLHDALADEGIRVAQLVIPGSIPKLQLDNGIDSVAAANLGDPQHLRRVQDDADSVGRRSRVSLQGR